MSEIFWKLAAQLNFKSPILTGTPLFIMYVSIKVISHSQLGYFNVLLVKDIQFPLGCYNIGIYQGIECIGNDVLNLQTQHTL